MSFILYMNRNFCVICDSMLSNSMSDELFFEERSNKLQMFNTVNIVSTTDYNPSEIKKINFVGCSECGCIQLQNLFLPSDIYSQPLQIFDGPAIQTHHNLFCDFIFKNTNYNSFLFEIGGSYGNLAKRIIEKYNQNNSKITYTIMEFDIKHYPEIPNIKYINGNCEDYNYSGINTIIMSHVFEHLYKPKDFVKMISNYDVQNIFISIPDMDGLMTIGDLNNLNILHTFYVNSKYIIYLFYLYGFILKDTYSYTNNSIFYFFVKSSIIKQHIEYKQPELLVSIPDFYINKIHKIQQINIDNPFYICPSGFYGQFVYMYLNENTKKNVLGFLDGHPFKINKRLSGTPLIIYDKTQIINSKYVLICSSKHFIELTNEFLKINRDVICIPLFN